MQTITNIIQGFSRYHWALACAALTLALVIAPQTRGEDGHVTLSPGDRVQISVFGHDDLSGEFEVDSTGRLSLPLIQGLRAQNLTLPELEQAIVDALQPDFLVNPRVTAQLLSLRPFFILGEVKSPGSYPYANGMTVVRAVAIAGGFTHRARTKRIVIQRVIDGVSTDLAATGDMLVQPGDVIEVPERFF